MKAPKKFHVVLVRVDGQFYLMADKDGVVCGFPSRAKALAHFRPYTNATRFGTYERSMSACVHFLVFAPMVVSVTQEWMQQHLDLNEEGRFGVARLYSVAGSMNGVLLRAAVEDVYNAGATPSLVSVEAA